MKAFENWQYEVGGESIPEIDVKAKASQAGLYDVLEWGDTLYIALNQPSLRVGLQHINVIELREDFYVKGESCQAWVEVDEGPSALVATRSGEWEQVMINHLPVEVIPGQVSSAHEDEIHQVEELY